jgi:hypothetical protein
MEPAGSDRGLGDLERHGLVEVDATGHYELTALGRLTGESATEVASIVRLVDCLGPLRPEEITDQTLIAAVQTTAELDQVHFPINKKSTQKEPQAWSSELSRQVLQQMGRLVADTHQATLRAKKAVACLLFVSGRPMNEVEAVLTQFGGASDGAAGPVRSVAARTCDLLGTAARVSEILHPELDLGERVWRLAIRLTLGVPASAVDLAREAGASWGLRVDSQSNSKTRSLLDDRREAAEVHPLAIERHLERLPPRIGHLRRHAGVAHVLRRPFYPAEGTASPSFFCIERWKSVTVPSGTSSPQFSAMRVAPWSLNRDRASRAWSR